MSKNSRARRTSGAATVNNAIGHTFTRTVLPPAGPVSYFAHGDLTDDGLAVSLHQRDHKFCVLISSADEWAATARGKFCPPADSTVHDSMDLAIQHIVSRTGTYNLRTKVELPDGRWRFSDEPVDIRAALT